MRKIVDAIVLITITISIAAARPAAQPARCDRSSLVLTRATLWTPDGLRSDQEVVISDGRIEAIGRSGQVRRPADTRVIDANGDTLLPGLIDAHAHLVVAGTAPKEAVAAARAQIYPATARQLLRSGVTSARIHLWDLEDGPAFVRESLDDCSPMPRLQQGGPGFIGGSTAFDGRSGWGVRDEADARAKVHRVQAAGATWIAIHNLDQFEPPILRAIVASARDAKLRIMAQGDTFAQIKIALDLGVDSLEYIDRSTAASYPLEILKELKSRGGSLFVVPPVGYYRRLVRFRADATLLDDDRLTEFMPESVGRFMLNHLRAQRSKPATGAALAIEQSAGVLADKFRQLRAAGVLMIVGSDCGSAASFQADSIWWELETWRTFGVPVADAVAAATSASARALGVMDVGQITPGRRADLVLYRGSLTDGPLHVAKVRTVVKGGAVFVHEGKWRE